MRVSNTVGLLVALGIVTSSCGPGPESTADELTEAVQALVTQDGLERLASAIVHYQRPSGSPGENAAIDSIVASLQRADVPVEAVSYTHLRAHET